MTAQVWREPLFHYQDCVLTGPYLTKLYCMYYFAGWTFAKARLDREAAIHMEFTKSHTGDSSIISKKIHWTDEIKPF